MMPRPPPPPPTPAIEDGDHKARQPSFIEQWIAKEKSKSPPSVNNNNKREYYEKQCLFPNHIPLAAHFDISPMIALISDHHLETGSDDTDDTSDLSNGQTQQHRSALDDVRKVASLCAASYKTIAIQNHKEFQYKKAKQQREQQADASEEKELPPQPTPSIYTDLSLPENFLMRNIHRANYNICLANATCPDQTEKLLKCWKSADKNWVKAMQRTGNDEYICMDEREAVERCLGLGVQRVMKDILG